MSELKATPGPWRVEEGTTLVWGACDPADRSTYGMGYPVTQARVRLGAATEYSSEFREDEAEANAHLIAAAPALYEALQWLFAIVLRDGLMPASVSYMQNAEAALKLARGEHTEQVNVSGCVEGGKE